MAQSPHTSVSHRIVSTPQMGLLWLGAAVSLAEILTGTFFAPLGFANAAAAILIGHAIGGVLFWFVSYASAQTGKSAMQVASMTFGARGSLLFSIANVIQLIGWTAIMIASGAAAALIIAPEWGMGAWCVILGALIVLWIALGPQTLARLQPIAAVLLGVLALFMTWIVFTTPYAGAPEAGDTLSFGAAVELAVAMPLSWLPVAGDYLRRARNPKAATWAATTTYFVGSSWMFFIGLGLALVAGTTEVAQVLGQAGFGIVGILIVVFSTVTTTFLDAESAGISAQAAYARIPARAAGIVAAIVGTILALVAPVFDFENFLYVISSIFAPMAAIVCVNCLVFHRDESSRALSVINLVLWFVGFVLYRISMTWDIPIGNTIVVMAIVALLTYVCHRAYRVCSARTHQSA